MSFPNKHRVKFIYWFCTQLSRFVMYLESSLWGYSWCKTCKGCKVYPNSGYYRLPEYCLYFYIQDSQENPALTFFRTVLYKEGL